MWRLYAKGATSRVSTMADGLDDLLDRRPVYRWLAVTFAALLGVAGALLFSVGSLIQANLLNESFYSRSLEENRVYDRVYEEVLADPAISAQINQSLNISDPQRAVAVSALRTLIPPDELQSWTEEGINAMVDYLAGRREDLQPNVDLAKFPLNRSEASDVQIKNDIAGATPVKSRSLGELVLALYSARDAISRGETPDEIPLGEVDKDLLPILSDVILSPLNSQARAAIDDQVVAHLTADDIRGALAVAAPYLAKFDGSTGAADDATPLASASAQINGWLGHLVTGVQPLRGAIRRYGPWMLPLSIVFLTLSWIVAGTVTKGDAFKRTAVASGVVIFSAVAGAILFWTISPGLLNGQLNHATSGEALSFAPESVKRIVTDVRRTIQATMRTTGTAAMLWIGVAGLVSTVIPIGIEIGKRRGRIDMRHPLWVPVGAWGLIIISMTWGPFALRSTVEARALPCNGHVELCGMRYDEVTFPATHNSMSNAAAGWIFPNQDATMERQLRDGVRTFLIDVHYWSQPDDYLKEVDTIDSLSPEARTYLAGLQGRFKGSPKGLFLCHASCWLGARPLSDGLDELKDFMEQHPREVVTLIIQDEVPGEQIAEAIEDAGLDEIAYAPEKGKKWPELGDMIDSGERLVVFAEKSGGERDWFQNAWDYMWDTRYDFKLIDDLNCDLNRGSEDNRLLLVNHWITGTVPDRSDATRMNSEPEILARDNQCLEERDKAPNFIAVDFYQIGDLLKAVDEVNGIGAVR